MSCIRAHRSTDRPHVSFVSVHPVPAPAPASVPSKERHLQFSRRRVLGRCHAFQVGRDQGGHRRWSGVRGVLGRDRSVDTERACRVSHPPRVRVDRRHRTASRRLMVLLVGRTRTVKDGENEDDDRHFQSHRAPYQTSAAKHHSTTFFLAYPGCSLALFRPDSSSVFGRMSFHGGDRHQVVSIIIQCRRQVVPIDGREEDRLEGQGGPRRDSVGGSQERGRGGAEAD